MSKRFVCVGTAYCNEDTGLGVPPRYLTTGRQFRFLGSHDVVLPFPPHRRMGTELMQGGQPSAV
jgi:hypothetical protein